MLNLAKVLQDNQTLSESINDIFCFQEDAKISLDSLTQSLTCPKRILNRLQKEIKKLDTSFIKSNKILDFMKRKTAKFNDWELKTLVIKKGTLFTLDETTVDEGLNEITPLGYFEEDIEVPALYEKGRIWMSLVPHEIVTMQKPLSLTKGRVLVYGLGMGYFALMAALKEDVKEVVVIEKAQEPINIYQKVFAQEFKEAKKIKILKMDAFQHASELKDGEFDNIFVDIYHDAEDGLPLYTRFLKIFSSFQATSVSYWIEETILTYFKRIIEIILIEQDEGRSEKDYMLAETPEDELINKTYHMIKKDLSNKEILSSNYVRHILTRG